MKKIIIIAIVFVFAACSKDYLERRSLTQISEANFFRTEQDFVLALNGTYEVLQDRVQYSGSLNGTAGFPMYDNLGDNAFNSFKFEGPGNFMEANITPDHDMFTSLWNSLYKGIRRANTVLEKIEAAPTSVIPDARKQIIKGQALFLRSLFYSHLAIYYQDAPLVLKVQELEEAYVPKNTYQEISTQVIKDLKDAANFLPQSYPAAQYGYATKGAALGLLARFLLYNKDYQGVLDATASVLTLGYTLNPSYAQLFTEQGELSTEIIFSVRFIQDASNNGELFSGVFLTAPKVDQQPMPNLVKDYYCTDGKPITTSPLYSPGTATNNTPQKNNRDPRLLASVYFRGDAFLVDRIAPVGVFTTNATTYGQKKYIRNANSPTGIAPFNPGGQDFIVIRYADVLLMRAEAMVELGQLTGVPALVNQVRARVNMPTVEVAEGTGLSQAVLRNIVRHERRVELAFEGLRYYDLKRWGTVQDAFNRAKADNIANYSARIGYLDRSTIFPIPTAELRANLKLEQNPVWK
ncbi:RagB/SusD family nutrient uptake outer membrane protein [Lacibacter luteus]|nr:RagB/SusD family nutrient uptake outer membrane protein [Lacibacter luteus]